jgi:hypothetical protein
MDGDIRRPDRPNYSGQIGPRPHAPQSQPIASPYQQQPIPQSAAPVTQPIQPQYQGSAAPALPPVSAAQSTSRWSKIAASVAVLVIIGLGAFVYHNLFKPKSAAAQYFPANITSSQIDIPVYYPVNLPTGFGVSDFKIIKPNVLSYVVSNSTNEDFYVIIQSEPASFDFASFKQKFTQPSEYTVAAGNVLIGRVGNSLAGSVQTTQKDWIFMNSTAINKLDDLQTITRAFKQINF